MPANHDQRRLTDRILTKWVEISQGVRMPRRAEITPAAFGDDWRYCTVVEIDTVLWRSRLAYVGDTLRNRDRTEGIPQILNDYDEGSLLRLTAAKIPAMIAKRRAMIFGGTGTRANKAMLYRAILLPLSEDNELIDHALGAINYREIAAVQEDSANDPVALAALPASAGAAPAFMALTGGRIAFPAPPAKKTTMPIILR